MLAPDGDMLLLSDGLADGLAEGEAEWLLITVADACQVREFDGAECNSDAVLVIVCVAAHEGVADICRSARAWR